MSEEEAAVVWCCWVSGLVACVVGEGLDSELSIANWVCFCCEVGEGRSFHCPVYLGLFGFTVSNCCSNGDDVAPLGT